jgi:hypothetical protein
MGLTKNKSTSYYILLTIDRFSGHIWTTFKKTMFSTMDIYNEIRKIITQKEFILRTITTDPGPQFTSTGWRQLWFDQGVGIEIAATHHAETDGLTERAIQTLTKKMQTYIEANKNKSWPQCLTAVTESVNYSRNHAKNYAPIEILKQEFAKTTLGSSIKIETPTNECYETIFRNTQKYTDKMKRTEQDKRGRPTRE